MTLYNRCPEFSARCRRAKAWPRRAALVLLSWACATLWANDGTYYTRCATLWANDGTYYTSGNQLLPLVETDIRVQREVLTLTWGEDLVAEVDVQYEFFNPGARKTVLMGFEADPPMYMDSLDRSGAHPYERQVAARVDLSRAKRYPFRRRRQGKGRGPHALYNRRGT